MAGILREVSKSVFKASSLSSIILSPKKIGKYQTANLVLKQYRDFDYPPAFPYRTKEYSMFDALFDHTTWRLNENSKVIVVDGPVAAGKTKLAKEIAEAFDLHYVPHVNLDSIYINEYGFDCRTLNDQMPPKCRSFDIHEFLQNPHDERTCLMQYFLYLLRMKEYVLALSHVLNTGQGVVLDRSIYTNEVFVDTFVEFGYFPKTFRTYINELDETLLPDLLRPHLIIYLDSPVNVILDRIKQRNLPGEKDSPIYKPEVLNFMETTYKKFLEKMEKNCELLVYDWSGEQNLDIVIEDMEQANLDNYHFNDPKMKGWRKELEGFWNADRMKFSQGLYSHFMMWIESIPKFKVKELWIDDTDGRIMKQVLESGPGQKYQKGYNVAMGDPNPIFRLY